MKLITTAGNILLRLLTAAVALNSPPFRQSSKVYRDCLSGLDIATLPLSTNVIFRTPQACNVHYLQSPNIAIDRTKILFVTLRALTISVRATWHPSVPAPRRRHLREVKLFKLREGKARHLISFKFKSAADMANL